MSLNWREIDLILSELPLEGCHIQKVRQPDYTTLVLDLYRPQNRFSLLISLRHKQTRLHSVSFRRRGRVTLQRFAQLLRSRIQGGRIDEAEQIEGERIVRFTIVRGGQTTYLFARLWGGASNIIATDESFEILDAFYRRPKRGEVTGNRYDPREQISESGGSQSTKQKRFTVRPYPEDRSFNNHIEEEYHRRELEDERDRLKKSADAQLAKERRRIVASLKKLESSAEEGEESESYKRTGDLLMSNLYRIEKGMGWVEVENFYGENEKTLIELDPTLTPQENAESYYLKYQKAKRAGEKVQEELRNKREELSKLENTEKHLYEAPDLETEVERLRDFVERNKGDSSRGGGEGLPGLRFASGQFTLLVGRNARENDELLRRYAKGNDYWVHTRDFPGGFVFIRYISGKSPPLETLLDAGNLAVYYSKGRSEGRVELYYTQVKYLRRAKDGKKGLVLPTQEKNITIEPDEERIKRLFSE